MLTHQILTRQEIGDVANYYGDAADDYYAKEGEAQVWQGKGAELLGLTGTVERERFRELLAGRVDPNGESVRVSTRDDSKTRIGIDLTFSAPKSVSIYALVGGDSAMIAAHDLAVQRTLEQAEAFAQARIKEAGKSRVETTGNLIIAKFRHETTRAQDPELHTHAVVMNLTRRSDGNWRALKNDEIIKMTRYLGAVYRAELAQILEKDGHALRHGRDGTFDLAAVSRDQIMAFSRRSIQIEAHLAAQGLTVETASATERQMATMKTRAKKDATLDRDELYGEWRARAAELAIDFGSRGQGSDAAASSNEITDYGGQNETLQVEAARRAVRFAINHLTERDAVMTKAKLTDTAIKHELGRTNVTAVYAAIAETVHSGRLVEEAPLYHAAGASPSTAQTEADWFHSLLHAGDNGEAALERLSAAIQNGGLVRREARYTTPAAIAREARVLAIERDGRGAVRAIMSAEEATTHFAGELLNAGQQSAAALILSTTNRVVGVEGFAGTGKSHMLDKAKNRVLSDGFARSGYNFQALAPYGTQKTALRELGVEARTVAAFLKAKNKKIDSKTVLVVDEAAVIPARQMAQLLSIVEQAGARVVLVFDRAQTKAIEAGRPVDQLVHAGMKMANMTEIQRQKNPVLKAAVEHAARGETDLSLAKIQSVSEILDPHERRLAVANHYLRLTPEERDKMLVVSGTNEARREINAHIRVGLGTAGTGATYDLLIRHDTTQEERRHAKNYEVGDTIQPENNYDVIGLKRGELYRVEATGPTNKLTVRAQNGAPIQFSPLNTKLSVYRTVREELAAGDLVKITHNDAALDVSNGDRFRVKSISPTSVTLDNGSREITLPADRPIHVDHAYTTTTHSSQSLTQNRTILDLDTKSQTTQKSTWYVGISRSRFDTHVYTDSRENLPNAIKRDAAKSAALDLRFNHQQKERASKAPMLLDDEHEHQQPADRQVAMGRG